MTPADLVLRTRMSLKSFAALYLGLGVLCAVIWWAGRTFDTGLSPLLVVGAGQIGRASCRERVYVLV